MYLLCCTERRRSSAEKEAELCSSVALMAATVRGAFQSSVNFFTEAKKTQCLYLPPRSSHPPGRTERQAATAPTHSSTFIVYTHISLEVSSNFQTCQNYFVFIILFVQHGPVPFPPPCRPVSKHCWQQQCLFIALNTVLMVTVITKRRVGGGSNCLLWYKADDQAWSQVESGCTVSVQDATRHNIWPWHTWTAANRVRCVGSHSRAQSPSPRSQAMQPVSAELWKTTLVQ